MQLVDVNVLVYAHREDAPDHGRYREWFGRWLDSDAAFAMSDLVLSGFVRVVTHPRVFNRPTPIPVALEFASSIRARPNCVPIAPGPRHWEIFSRLCNETDVRGNLVPDAYLAALAIEAGCEWISTDRDYSRFPGLRWRHPIG
ncbi:MAG: PIN domain-containing protein [Acidobacteria bacterium]|nr:PIN domain-containing protein [Acidobacteriota bacterium]NIM62409.1 PIN domain-containing protein [Acidobacteriota bacterium]NIO60703.1 PIN domain-containing protein [Acidobacteriota bacterium]NIQ31768.1 PIN domain-containing protein [Acidobacteriota bacterium]NIQ87074.1 PIN domain-containing protein [Acidobacteriota bacterium]